MRTRSSTQDARVTLYEPEEESDEPPVERIVTPKSASKRSSNSDAPSSASPKKKIKLALDVAHPAPKRWKECLDVLTKQRATIVAPVDTMGCDEAGKLEDDSARPDTDDRSRRFQTLVSLMLSSQTKDPVTAAATANLRSKLAGGLTLESVLAATEEEIQECINKVGFWRRKTVYIKAMAEILKDSGGDVPKNLDDLLALPGVGPKMAFLALQSCWDLNLGIGVDTHVHRITNRLGWHKKETKDAEETRLNLESWLPKELHRSINKTLVGFGQVICLPVGPRCDLCEVAKIPRLCPSKRHVNVRSPAKIKKKEEDDALIKIEVPAALVGEEQIEGTLLQQVDGQVDEIRVVKTEEGERIEQDAQSLSW